MAAKGNVIIDLESCKGCGLCVEYCPKKVLEIEKDVISVAGYNPAAVKFPEDCILCGFCYRMCPDTAITIEKTEEGAQI